MFVRCNTQQHTNSNYNDKSKDLGSDQAVSEKKRKNGIVINFDLNFYMANVGSRMSMNCCAQSVDMKLCPGYRLFIYMEQERAKIFLKKFMSGKSA